MPLSYNYTVVFDLQLRRSMKMFSQDSWLVLETSRCVHLSAYIRGSLDWPSEHVLLSCPWATSVSPWLAQVPSKLPRVWR
jgi:hypothetical protein